MFSFWFCEDTQVRISPGAADRAEKHKGMLLPVLEFLNAWGLDFQTSELSPYSDTSNVVSQFPVQLWQPGFGPLFAMKKVPTARSVAATST